MQKFFLVLTLIFLGCTKSKVPLLLAQDYNFITTDGDISKLRQVKDTLLYTDHCFFNKPCLFNTGNKWKIIAINKVDAFTVLKIESIRPSGFPASNNSSRNYSILVLKSINNDKLSFKPPLFNLARGEFDTFQISSQELNKIRLLTFFSDSYLQQLSLLKKVNTKADAKEIINAIRNNDFDAGIISFSAEELNKACIEKGYNPIGAGQRLDALMK